MRPLVALLLTVSAWAGLPAEAAHAACIRQDVVEYVQGVAQVNTQVVCDAAGQGGDQGGDQAEPAVQSVPLQTSGLDPICVQGAISNDVDPTVYCDEPSMEAPPEQPVTPGIVLSALRRLPLPAAELVVQPPHGRTLVNFATNFYTEQSEFARTVTLLGRQVELRIWPDRFTWRFGDGASLDSASPGSAYPGLEITHEYRRRGRVRPSVDVTYAARFRVGGGPWRDVAGTVTIPGSSQSLRVVSARPALVGG